MFLTLTHSHLSLQNLPSYEEFGINPKKPLSIIINQLTAWGIEEVKTYSVAFKTLKRLRFARSVFTFQINRFTVLGLPVWQSHVCVKVRKIILFAVDEGGGGGLMPVILLCEFFWRVAPLDKCYLLWTKKLKFTVLPFINCIFDITTFFVIYLLF